MAGLGEGSRFDMARIYLGQRFVYGGIEVPCFFHGDSLTVSVKPSPVGLS